MGLTSPASSGVNPLTEFCPSDSTFGMQVLAQRSPLDLSAQLRDAQDVTAALHRTLAESKQPPAIVVHAATEFARILTGAGGVMLGVRLRSAMVCRARSGDLAPELGAVVRADAGLSGECLSSASILVCHDAELDARVDREACRALGLRSILAVPLRGPAGIAGILEAFSTRPDAFQQEHIEALRALAEVIETANGCDIPSRKAPTLSARRVPLARRMATAEKLSREILVGPAPLRRYWILGVTAAALVLTTLGVWLSWRDPTPDMAANTPALQPVKTKKEDVPRPIQHTTFLKPEAGIVPPRSEHARTVLKRASQIERVGNDTTRTPPASADAPEEVGEGFVRTASVIPASEAVRTTSIPAPVTTEIAQPHATPASSPTEASLVYRVEPNYPERARASHLTGAVVVSATIAEDGSVRSIGLVSGPPLLGAAAIEAVRQWRYSPALLEGKAVESQKRISLAFTLP